MNVSSKCNLTYNQDIGEDSDAEACDGCLLSDHTYEWACQRAMVSVIGKEVVGSSGWYITGKANKRDEMRDWFVYNWGDGYCVDALTHGCE